MSVSLPLDEQYKNLRRLLIREEGLKLKVYTCTQGKLTLGVGHNVQEKPISERAALVILNDDIADALQDAMTFSWFTSISVVRQDVILSMLFQMGLRKFKTFKKMIEALRCGNFAKASEEMIDSDWAKQTPLRAQRHAYMMLTGKYASEN